jgi:hypothetical protein
MGNENTRRIQSTEGGSTFVSPNLERLLREIDFRFTTANHWLVLTRDGDNLVQEMRYYRDAAKTNLAVKRVVTRITGLGGLKLISTITTTFYEEDGITVDSTVSSAAIRTSNATLNRITDGNSPFTTSESVVV